MDGFLIQLNSILVDTFRSILKVEEQMLKKSKKIDLSISEMHLIESISKSVEKGKTISELADDLDITLPSVTIAINKLFKKGYVQKIRCTNDGRAVIVTLTSIGEQVNRIHQYFHEKMVKSIAKDLTSEEKDAMMKGIIKLNAFFKKRLDKVEKI